MTRSRKSLSNLIERIQSDFTLIDRLQPSVFESLATELIAQNNIVSHIERNISPFIDVTASLRDPLGVEKFVGLQFMHMQSPVAFDKIQRISESFKTHNFDETYLFSNSGFTDSARRLAETLGPNLRLMDDSSLKTLIENYTSAHQAFSSNLYERLRLLDLSEILEVTDPDPSDLESLDPAELEISDSQRKSLLTVSSLPFKVIAQILRSPAELRNLSPRQFEEFIAETLVRLGFNDVVLTPRSRDGGKDVIASQEISNIPITFYFECKKYAEDNKIQLETLRSLLGTLAHEAQNVNKGVLVTTSTFTSGANKFILSEARLDGKDYDGIVGWISDLNKKL